MSLISLRNVRVAFSGPPLLENLSLDIQAGQRVCVLGRNGAGKSTLLKLMSGDLTPDAGEIERAPNVQAAFLPQDVPGDLTGAAFEIVAAGAGPAGRLLAAHHRAAAEQAAAGALDELAHDLTLQDGWRLEPVVRRVLSQVQIPPEAEFASLSGGLRRRVLLARALVREPQVLLLDEPTNHLDLESIAWLESFLLAARLTVVFVTHDRRLLKKLATRIVEIDRGRVADWSCDYATFLERKQAVLEQEAKAWAHFDKKLAQEEVWIRQGVRARRTRNEGRVRALLKMREERRRRRDRIGQVSMQLSAAERSGDRVLEAKNVSFGYGEREVIRNFTFLLARGDRVGVVGPNGCGKTTLLNLMLGRLAPRTGTLELGAQVAPIYFDQLREGIDPEKTVWENVSTTGNDTVVINGRPRNIIGYLQDFLFTSDRARTPVKRLSGGERHRLLLARLFTVPANLLVFDEPTNDLDAETLELLEETLQEFQGTLIVVSHDREFLNNVVTSALLFSPDGTVAEYVGGYDDWERQWAAAAEPVPPRPAEPRAETRRPPAPERTRKLSFKEKTELERLPAEIESLESEVRTLHGQLADFTQCQKPGFVAQAKARLAALESALTDRYARWEALEDR